MKLQRGRPKSKNPKDIIIRCRIDEQLNHELTQYCIANGVSKTEVMIEGIKQVIRTVKVSNMSLSSYSYTNVPVKLSNYTKK